MSTQSIITGTTGTRRRSGRPVALMLPALVLTVVLMVVHIGTTIVRVIADRGEGLVVMSSQVVESADGWCSDGGVVSVMIVEVHPGG